MVAFVTVETLFLYEVVGSMRSHLKRYDNFTTGASNIRDYNYVKVTKV